MRLRLASCLLLFTTLSHANQTPEFDVHDWPVWAQTQWAHANYPPQSISVTVINRSPLETDDAQQLEADSMEDIESAGVPTKAFELWFNHQLTALGVFEIKSAPQARFQFEVIILEYQPLFTADGPAGFWRDTQSTFVRWYQDWQEPGLATRVNLSARLTDTQTGVTTTFSTFIQAPPCQRLNVAASFPMAAQSPFFELWSRSLIGQTSIASMNRLTHWLMQFPSKMERQFFVRKVLGSRLEIERKDASFAMGEELLIHHKGDHRELGKAKIVRQRGDTFVAYPLTMHPAAVAEGDYVRVFDEVPDLIRYPAQIIKTNQCATTKTIEPILALYQPEENAEQEPPTEALPEESPAATNDAIPSSVDANASAAHSEPSATSDDAVSAMPMPNEPAPTEAAPINDKEKSISPNPFDPRD